MEHETFTWFGAVSSYPQHVLTAGLVAALIVAFGAFVSRQLANTEAALEPEDGFTARNLAEVFVESMTSLANGVIGHHAERYVPLLASFFIFHSRRDGDRDDAAARGVQFLPSDRGSRRARCRSHSAW